MEKIGTFKKTYQKTGNSTVTDVYVADWGVRVERSWYRENGRLFDVETRNFKNCNRFPTINQNIFRAASWAKLSEEEINSLYENYDKLDK